ncbi:MAG: MFS transporter [Opitutaceae bacterium]|jgi:MFS family permease|nr:MFS transporter [Opitutaceae bacterium]
MNRPIPQRFRVLALLFLGSMITYLDRVCISVSGKNIQEELGISLEQWGWVLGAFVIAYGIFEIPGGALGDKYGPRKILTRIVAWWSAFTVLTGLAQGFRQLLIVRFLFGAGEAGAFPNFSAAIARWFPIHERARAQSFVWMASRLGGALSPVLVIPLQQWLGWRAVFYVFGAAGLLWTLAWWFFFRDHPAEKRGVTRAELEKINPMPIMSDHRKTPWKQIFSKANIWWVMLMYHANAWCVFFYLTWLHIFLVNGRGFTPRELVMFSWLPFVFGAGANLLGGITSDFLVRRTGLKWGRRLVGVGGLGAATVFLTLTIFTQAKLPTILFLALAYGFSDFALPVAWAVCLDIGQKNAGVVTGAMNMAAQAGSFLTTVLFGYIVVASGSYNAPLIPIAVMSLVATLAWLKINPASPLSPATEPAPPNAP